MKDKWLDELREGLSDFEIDAPPGLWESLGVDKAVAKSAWRRKYMTVAAAVAIFIIGTGYLVWEMRIPTLNRGKVSESAYGLHTLQIPSMESEASGTVSQHDETPTLKPTRKAGLKPSLTAEENPNLSENSSLSEDSSMHAAIDSDATTMTEENTENKGNLKRTSDESISTRDESIYDRWQRKQKRGRRSAERYALAISASGIGSSSERTSRPVSSPWFDDNFLIGDDYHSNGFDYSNGPVSGDDPYTTNEVTDIHHHLPIKIGVAIQYNLSERLGIESGLIYEGLETDISVSKEHISSTGTRKLHYIGIPINVKYSALSWKLIDIYLSAGVAVEKCIYNRFETKSLSELSLESFAKQKEKPFQWSVNAAAGIQLRATPNIGIFAEPGVSYYFNDGTTLSTIYKDRPCNFSLNLGIRFSLNP